MKRVAEISISLLLAGLIVGCGGSGGDITPSTNKGTGYYVDSAVAGVNYVCGAQTGVTDSDGKFVYEINKECTFSVGNTILRKISKEDLSSKEFTVIENNITIASLLQTLDNDGDASNGITITKEVRDALKENDSTTLDINAIFDTVSNVSEYRGHFVTETEAGQHLGNTVKSMLAGKTFYVVIESGITFFGVDMTEDSQRYVMPVQFDENLTRMSSPQDSSVALSINFDGSNKLYINGNQNSYMLIEGKTDKYIKETTIALVGMQTMDHWRFYYNESDATAYANSLNGSGSTGGSTGGGSTGSGYSIVQNIPDNAKGLMIYNNVSSAEADNIAAEILTQNSDYNYRYNSNNTLYCSDYGYSYLFADTTDSATGVQSKTYLISQNNYDDMCLEMYYNSGSNSMAVFK
ncbi:Autotransporter adhesin [hydrothermal vent metagenome]|uniref:Autotransporter adhesin n=1 Tax=hydrothermal vent metagenome TaxID=652676 RepID=A0A1W1BRU3_9ZZZZ